MSKQSLGVSSQTVKPHKTAWQLAYAEKLKSPLWQKCRLKVMEYANWRCQICGTKDNTLHCHHSYYTKGKEPWQYPKGAIICICEGCHEKIHGKKKEPASKAEVSPVVEAAYQQPQADAIPKSRFGALRAAVEKAAADALARGETP